MRNRHFSSARALFTGVILTSIMASACGSSGGTGELGGVASSGGAGGAGGAGGQGGTTEQSTGTGPTPSSDTGMLIKIPAIENPDIAQFLFSYTRVECYPGEPYIPETFEAYEAPLNAGPNNPDADHFEPLLAGCYDIMVMALDSNGNQLPECSMDSFEAVVFDNKTTEVTAFIQCDLGPESGGINTTLYINYPPWFSDGKYTPNKWVSACDPQEICASFTDPDKDNIEFEWSQIAGIPLALPPTFVSHTKVNGTSTECVTIQHGGVGKVELLVKAYDMMPNPFGPGEIRVEDYLQQKGIPYQSHDTMQLFSFGMETDACPCVPAAEICDDIDNDCDGAADDGLSCACIIGEKTACYTGPANTLGVGSCTAGYKECLANGSGFEAACHEESKPVAEKADGQDNDCDGSIDDNAPCIAGAPCYFGPNGTKNVGICQGGIQVCNANGFFASCMGQVLPQPEIANNNLDDNCNGQKDESAGGGLEICNGLDDDMDGQIDEGLGSKSCGVGACQNTVAACVNGQVQVCTPGMPVAEIPGNMIDDDCDGATDEMGGSEVCNGVDDDGDGLIDEGLGTFQCGVGACHNTIAACINGQSQVCVPGQPAANDTCGDNIDNNCNGATDEGCGGVCSPPSPEVCDANGTDEDHDGLINAADNSLSFNGNPIFCCPTGAEVVDNIDNDCDGMIDEYLSCFPTQPLNQEIPNQQDDNCNGLIDEGTANCTYAPEICDGLDQDCDLVPDNGLNCGYSLFAPTAPAWNTGALADNRIGFSQNGTTAFALKNYFGSLDYPGVRYNSLPMPVGSGKWYWEAPVAWTYGYGHGPCIGVGSSDTPLTGDASGTLSNLTDAACLQIHDDGNGGYAGYLFPGDIKILSWDNKDFKGAVLSVLVDMNCGTITFWVNGDAATGGNIQVPVALTANKTYYPMAWMQDNLYSYYGYYYYGYDVSDLNFGPTFFHTKPAGYQQHN